MSVDAFNSPQESAVSINAPNLLCQFFEGCGEGCPGIETQSASLKASEAKRQQQINEAEGEGQAILTVAKATAESIERVAVAIQNAGGRDAVQLRIAEQWITEFGKLARVNNTMIVPANLTDLSSIIASATGVLKHVNNPAPAPPPPVQR